MSRDFTVSHGLCRLCRHMFDRWPGWPSHTAWADRYPGDLVLPVHHGFLPSAFLFEEGCLPYQQHPRLSWDSMEGKHPIHRVNTQIVYQECRVCYLIHQALCREVSNYSIVDIGIFPLSESTVHIYLQVTDGQKQPIHTCLRLDLLRSDRHVCAPAANSTSTGDNVSMERLQKRLSSCLGLRPKSTPPWAPTRLIEVEAKNDSGLSVRLVHSEQLPFIPQYMTLSHRWGGDVSLTLSHKTIDSFQKMIPWSVLPKTFSDALILTHRLGFSYLWIDCLCILQDSEFDWGIESAQMSEVYTNTSLNIYTDCAKRASAGFFRRRNTPDLLIRTNWPRMPGSLWQCQIDHRHMFENHRSGSFSYLGSRGWVVQEEMLPYATVYFGHDGIFWMCHHGVASESLSIQEHSVAVDTHGVTSSLGACFQIREALQTTDCSLADKMTAWNRVTEQYNACDLTFESDKAVAIAGIAKRFCDLSAWLAHDFLAGHWRSSLIESILWRPARLYERPAPVSSYSTYVAPSWSWMSVKGRIRQDHLLVGTRGRAGFELVSKVIAAEVSAEAGGFGRVSSGFIDVRGPVWRFFTLQDKRRTMKGDISMVMMWCGHSFAAGCHDCHLYLDVPSHGSGEKGDFLDVFYLPIRLSVSALRSHGKPNHFRFFLDGLLLEHIHDRRGEYRRLGTAHIPLISMEHPGCTEHDLLPIEYLQKHDRSSAISQVAGKILRQRSDTRQHDAGQSGFQGTIQQIDAESMQIFKESIADWEQHGDDFWPATDLDMVRRGTFMEAQYTVRLL